MSSESPTGLARRGAVVVATGDDEDSTVLLIAAKEVERMLSAGFDVISFVPLDKRTDIYVDLRLRAASAEADRTRFVVGYFCSHGSNRGLFDASGREIFERWTARLFSEAIVILNACLDEGELPSRMVAGGSSVIAVLGYRLRLVALRDKAAEKFFGDRADEFTKRFLRAVTMPIVELSKQGCSVKDARAVTLRMWGELWCDRSLPKEVRHVAETNATRLCLWLKEGVDDAVLFPS